MTTFQEARAFLLQHRTDYATAVKGFRWPDPGPFNWALGWFDTELARHPESRDRAALWIVDAGSDRETKLSFQALAAMKLGVVVIPATTLLTPDELRDRLDRGRARVVVASQEQVAKFAGLGADQLVRIVVNAPSKQEGWLAYERAADFPEAFTPDASTNADDPMLLY